MGYRECSKVGNSPIPETISKSPYPKFLSYEFDSTLCQTKINIVEVFIFDSFRKSFPLTFYKKIKIKKGYKEIKQRF